VANEIEGVKATIAELRKIEPAVARQAVKDIKAVAQPTANELKATAPAVPLSRMGNYGPTKVAVKYGGRKDAQGKSNLVSIRLTGPGWTVASDMARNASAGESMVANLTTKYGKPSRWAWPTVERRLANIQRAIADACKQVEREATKVMR